MKGIIERAIASIDLEAITTDVMSKLVISKLEMYFVVYQLPDSDTYEMVGMTYSEKAAKLLWLENSKKYPCKILKFDMGKLLHIVEQMGATEEIS